MTVGRYPKINDVVLAPDLQRLVGREAHCSIERQGGGWWVVDNGSRNGTCVRRSGVLEAVKGKARLANSDVICLLSRVTKAGKRLYWELTFSDPEETQRVTGVEGRACIEYEASRGRIIVVVGSRRVPIKLTEKQETLIRYMVDTNAAHGGKPTLCPHDDLIRAVWGPNSMDSGWTAPGSSRPRNPMTRLDLAGLVSAVQQKVQTVAPGTLVFENVHRRGYILHTCP
ncbi:MAG: FHA domain-containing protein [Acidobacteria bacterium]|nr:FHA domain-containing protein [Acidobacteriota bacterium]